MAAQTVSTVRTSALRSRCLSFEKTCSIGLRSGEYFGSGNSLAPAERMIWLMALPQWLLILKANWSDFDPAIPRFESWRPSQPLRC